MHQSGTIGQWRKPRLDRGRETVQAADRLFPHRIPSDQLHADERRPDDIPVSLPRATSSNATQLTSHTLTFSSPTNTSMPSSHTHLPPLDLPQGITSNYVETSELTYHTLEAGYDASRSKPLILCLHGFPELAYSWRKIMPLLAARGFYVVAYDQRGYGRTTGWDARPYDEVDLSTFSFTSLVTDAVRLVSALGYTEVKCLLGHDFGGVGAAMCALMRPDMFRRCIVVSPHLQKYPR